MKTLLLFIATLSITVNLNEENLLKAIKYTDQEKAITEIATNLEAIKNHYKIHKNTNNRFKKAKNIKLLAYSIEEEYKKAQPLIEKHYRYLETNNYYGMANDKCFAAKRNIEEIFKKLELIRYLATKIINSSEDDNNSWAYSYYNLVNA